MKKILILILFLLLRNGIQSQDQLKIQYDYASTLFSSGKFYDAITEYKRFLFFEESREQIFDVNLKIGQCYKAGAKLDDAIKYFSIAEINSKDDTQKHSAKIEIVKANILRRTTVRALQILDDMEKETAYSSKVDSLNYWRGWAYIFEDDWEGASRSFAKINPYHELRIVSDKVINDKYSVTFAKVISYILPGSGQIYTGNYLSGVMSLGYNVLFGYLTVNSFVEERVFDGIATGSLLWLRFYRGSIQNAEKFAIEKNIEISNKTLRFLQNEYLGAKP